LREINCILIQNTSNVFNFFWLHPPFQKYSIFWYQRRCRMCSASVLTRELNIREQSLVLSTQSILSTMNQPNLTGPKLPLAIQWDFIRRFFRTNDDYPDYSGANYRLSKGDQV
jgi:hypothetical protein